MGHYIIEDLKVKTLIHIVKKIIKLRFKTYIFLKQRRNIYIVYSMGKVGSSTVYETLRNSIPINAIFHVHYLSDNYLKDLLIDTAHERLNVNKGLAISDYIKQNSNKRLKIITIVRDPLAQAISNFFENYHEIVTKDELYNMSIPLLINTYNDRIKHFPLQGVDFPLNYFETEFGKYLNIDIYDLPFNKQKGYSFYSLKNFDLIIFTIEKLNDNLLNGLTEISNIKIKKIINANESKNKKESGIYKEFIEHFKVSNEEIAKIYSSKFVNHFYTAEDVERFRKRWSDREL